MGKKIIPICLAFIIITASCISPSRKKDRDTQDKIEQIWVLSDQELDSAIAKSKRLEGTVYTSSEYTRMKYDMLNIRLRYKKDIPASSIDSIKRITSFMEKHGTRKDLMRAYYYMGGIYEDLHDSPRAIEYTRKSLDCGEDTKSCDSIIAQMCYSLLSEIYRKQHNAQEAVNAALAGLEIAKLTGKDMCWYTMDVATSYNMADDDEKAMEYYDRAYKLLMEENKHRANLQLIAEMTHVYAFHGNYERADTLVQMMERIPEHKRLHSYYYAKGVISNAHDATGDSTIMYFKKAIEMAPDTYEKFPSLVFLFGISNAKEDYKSSAIYAWQYQKGIRELRQHEQQEWIKNANGVYEYQKNKEQEDTLAWENALARLLAIAATCALLCAVAIIAALHFRYKKMIIEANVGKLKELEKLQNILHEKNKEIQEKEDTLHELGQNVRELEEKLARRKAQTEEIIRLYNLAQAKAELGQTIEKIERAVCTGKGMEAGDWQELLCAVDAKHPTFRTDITERIPRISEVLLHTCYLMKIGMSKQQIEVLTNSARQTVWNRVNKIREAMDQNEPTAPQ